MVVAADDGVMPQTREHAAVLARARRRRRASWRSRRPTSPTRRARARRRRSCCRAPRSSPVAAPRGEGLDELRAALDRVAAALPGPQRRRGALRLHVDRSFTIRGAGTVVTGTLWAGSRGARRRGARSCPSGRRARVRSVAGPRRAGRAGRGRPAGRAQPRRASSRDEVGARRRGGRGRRTARPASASTSPLAWVTPDARPDGGTRVARPPRHARDARPARGARRPLLPAPARAAARAGPRRPARDPLAGAAGHARRRRRARPRPAPARPVAATCSPGSRAWSAASRNPSSRRRRPSREPAAARPLTPAALALEERLKRRRPRAADPTIDAGELAALRAHGRIVRLGRDMHLHRDALADVARTRASR